MKAIAWVVEVPHWWVNGGESNAWVAWKIRGTRNGARSECRQQRQCGCPCRVRQYVRVEEGK